MTKRDFDKQTRSAHDQAFRTIGVPAIYVDGSGSSKNIRVIFDNRDAVQDDEPTRFVAPHPVISAKASDINDENTDTATITIDGTTYTPDVYINDGAGLIKIQLRV